jgi:hypothetical protein
LWVSANRIRIACRISASETVTVRAASRQLMPNATVLTKMTGLPAAKYSA